MDNDIRKRLEQHLRMAVFRLRRMGGAVAVQELFGAIGDSSSLADEVDVIQANESREIGFATRELLLERVNRLSEALDRLNRGEYGICAECGEPISRARLHAMPEVLVRATAGIGPRKERGNAGSDRRQARCVLTGGHGRSGPRQA